MTIESTLERIATALETLAAAPKAEVTDAPKVTRRRTTAAGAAEKESAPSTTATNATEADASTAKSDPETDDLFGEEAAPEVKEEKAKKLTIDDVKAALVAVQTALKHKDHALTLLSKHTVPKGEKVLSKLPEANYAALIKEADSAIKAGKVTP